MSSKIRDVVLLLVAVGLVVAALLPAGESDPEPEGKDRDPASGVESALPEAVPEVAVDRVVPGASPPISDVEHSYFPLVTGSTWVYRVEGPEEIAGGDTWTMVLKQAPGEGAPGELLCGYGDERELRRIWFEGGAVRTDALPAKYPLQLEGSGPVEVEGSLLPAVPYIIEGGVWKHIFRRKVTYESRDRSGKTHVEEAMATQSDRAMVKERDEVIVPAGRFDAIELEWIARVDIEAKKRKVLREITSEPFRKETMWFARGIGPVRRFVQYTGVREGIVSFDLVMYKRPSVESY